MRYIVYLFWLVVLLLGLSFASLNPHSVTIRYYFGTTLIAVPVLLAVTLGLGFVLGWLITIPLWIKARYVGRRCKQQLKQRDQEIAVLRTQSATTHPLSMESMEHSETG